MCAHARVHRDPERRVHTYTPRSSCDSVCAAVDDRDAWKRTGGARHTDINIPSWNVINHRRIRRSSPVAALVLPRKVTTPRPHTTHSTIGFRGFRVSDAILEQPDRSRDDNYSNWFDYLTETPGTPSLLRLRKARRNNPLLEKEGLSPFRRNRRRWVVPVCLISRRIRWLHSN